jgi:polar amino acid transport system substrate-binding protein
MRVGCLRRWLGALALSAVAAACPAADLHAFTEPLPPLNYEDSGEVRGFSTDLLRMMLQRAGLSGSFEVLPWPRAVQMAAGDTHSVLYTLTRTPARETQYRWVGPIAKRRILLFRLADRPEVQVRSLDDLRRIHTAVARESATAKQLAELGYSPFLDVASNDEASMRMLIAGRVDAVAMLDFAAAWQSQRQGPGFKALQPLITLDDQHEYYYGLHKDAPDTLVQALQRALDSLRREGEVDRLAQRYFQ